MPVHPSAVVHPGAKIDSDAEIGPFCSIGDEVEIGSGTRLLANVYVEGPTRIGSDNVFQPFSTVGVAPQDLKYRGERSETRIGDRNQIREFVTIHRGTKGGGALTSIGDERTCCKPTHTSPTTAMWGRAASWPTAPRSAGTSQSKTGPWSAPRPACINSAAWARTVISAATASSLKT